ncbi:hypothetical protein PAMC26510_18290 [Caballeronia sordidicola]|uniref:Uncharacterized protein n=1 Tax=Caballeronia sordidicola TaxID=196367 RepID=A0A2C9XV56_CABSO|nr:hypothetical protein PAMC26510_18290 [Caballeronia sordidicola]
MQAVVVTQQRDARNTRDLRFEQARKIGQHLFERRAGRDHFQHPIVLGAAHFRALARTDVAHDRHHAVVHAHYLTLEPYFRVVGTQVHPFVFVDRSGFRYGREFIEHAVLARTGEDRVETAANQHLAGQSEHDAATPVGVGHDEAEKIAGAIALGTKHEKRVEASFRCGVIGLLRLTCAAAADCKLPARPAERSGKHDQQGAGNGRPQDIVVPVLAENR